MSLAHVHLLLNHFPTIGMIIGVGLLLAAIARKSADLTRASLVIFVGIALLTIPTYVTGNAAREEVCKAPQGSPPNLCPDPYPGVSEAAAEAHEAAALPALALIEITGAFAWLGLWQFRRFSRLPRWTLTVTLLCSLVALGLASRAAILGGAIRHLEVRDVQPVAPATQDFARVLGGFVVDTPWMWPTCETVHFLGLSLLFGVAALIDFRILGLMKSLSFRALHRVLPWGILGFGLNLVTGMLFFVGTPQQYDQSLLFYLKLALIILAGANLLYFTMFEEAWEVGPGEDAPFKAKAVAVSTLVLVVGALYCGRMLPFLGTSF
jgi:hypothetical protein